MAGIGDLLSQALMGQKQQLMAQDPFLMAGQAAMQYPLEIDPSDGTQALILNLSRGLMGGALSTYGKQNVDKAFNTKMEGIKSGFEGGNIGDTFLQSSDPALFAAGIEMDQNQKAAMAEREQSLNDFIFKENAKAQIKGQYAKPGKIDEQSQPVSDPIAQELLRTAYTGAAFTPEQAESLATLSPKMQATIMSAREKTAKLTPQTLGNPGAAQSGDLNVLNEIVTRVPKNLQGKAMAEAEYLEKSREVDAAVNTIMDEGYAASTASGYIPYTADNKVRKSTLGGLSAIVQSVWKGPMIESEFHRTVAPFMPDITDTPKTLEAKKAQIKNVIAMNKKGTPILNSIGIGSDFTAPAPMGVSPQNPAMQPQQAAPQAAGGIPARQSGESLAAYKARTGL